MSAGSKIYNQALVVTATASVLLFAINYTIGTQQFFLLLNTDFGKPADFIFSTTTYLGDGVMWVPLVLYILFKDRKNLVLIIAAIIVSTAITHLFKDLLIPNEARPTKAIADMALIHVVKGVELHTIGSFPSGHTTTAFCIFLILTLLFNNKKIFIIGFILALIVGYSRVYLAQHFPRDVAGGMLAAVITLLLSVKLQNILFTGEKAAFTP